MIKSADFGASLAPRTLASLLERLQLPDDDSGAKVRLGVRSVKARQAAHARWGKWDA